MADAAALENVQYYEDLADKYNSEIRRYEKWIEELEKLDSQLAGIQSLFGENQLDRKGYLSAVSGLMENVNSARIFYEGMNAMLCGSKYYDAFNGMYEAKSIVRQQINVYLNNIESCRGYAVYYADMADYWHTQMETSDDQGE